jgi:hypothetical protein
MRYPIFFIPRWRGFTITMFETFRTIDLIDFQSNF